MCCLSRKSCALKVKTDNCKTKMQRVAKHVWDLSMFMTGCLFASHHIDVSLYVERDKNSRREEGTAHKQIENNFSRTLPADGVGMSTSVDTIYTLYITLILVHSQTHKDMLVLRKVLVS